MEEETLITILIYAGPPLFLLLVGICFGRLAEAGHFRRLARREAATAEMLVTDIKTFPNGFDPSHQGVLVSGQAVIATDYFKSFVAGIRKIFGGELRAYQTLMTRARREALLRMIEQAKAKGYDSVCNVRLETADIGGTMTNNPAVMVECFAYGTAYKRKS
jgi:uncharacterized protein YbjQ (UPF0145 family)